MTQESSQGAAQLREGLTEQLARKEECATAAEAAAAAQESEAHELKAQLALLNRKAAELQRESCALRSQMLSASCLGAAAPAPQP